MASTRLRTALARMAAGERRRERGQGWPEVFEFFGFTHICGRTKAGKFLLYRCTSKSRMRAKLKLIRDAVVRSYFAYHAVPTTGRSMCSFRVEVTRYWLHALRRRSQRSRMTWQRMQRLANHWIPAARILHPYPWDRFDDRTRGRSRVR